MIAGTYVLQDDISFPMPFNQADSTLEEEAEEETLKFGRSASDPNMDTVLPTLQQSVARFGLHQRQRYYLHSDVLGSIFIDLLCEIPGVALTLLRLHGRNGLSSAPSFDIQTSQRPLTDSVSSDRSRFSGPVVGTGRHLGDDVSLRMPSSRRSAASGSGLCPSSLVSLSLWFQMSNS